MLALLAVFSRKVQQGEEVGRRCSTRPYRLALLYRIHVTEHALLHHLQHDSEMQLTRNDQGPASDLAKTQAGVQFGKV